MRVVFGFSSWSWTWTRGCGNELSSPSFLEGGDSDAMLVSTFLVFDLRHCFCSLVDVIGSESLEILTDGLAKQCCSVVLCRNHGMFVLKNC